MAISSRAVAACAATMVIMTAAAVARPARADLALVQSVSQNGGGPLAPGAPTTVRVYVSGPKTRTDAGPLLTTIIDLGARTLTLLDRRTKTFTVRPYDATQRLTSRDVSVSVTDTRRTGRLLGHPVRLFRARGKSLGTSITAEIWAAENIRRPVIATLFNGTDEQVLAPIRGLPLSVRLTVSPGGAAAPLTLTTRATFVSTAALPAATFAVPAGFRPAQQ